MGSLSSLGAFSFTKIYSLVLLRERGVLMSVAPGEMPLPHCTQDASFILPSSVITVFLLVILGYLQHP